MLAVPLDLLQISRFRSPAPLPWPPAQAVALARAVGFVDPVTVRPLPGAIPPRYEILTGLRHWLLAQRAQLASVTIQLRESLSDDQARRLVELDTGLTFDPIAEARAIQAEVEQGLSITAAGRVFGLSRTEASHRLRLLRLTPSVWARVATGTLDPGKARALVGMAERDQIDLAQRIAREDLNTRQVEALAKACKQGDRHPQASPGIPPPAPAKDPNLVRLENDLAEFFGTRVTLAYEGGRGQLVIDFVNLEILEGVLEKIGYRS